MRLIKKIERIKIAHKRAIREAERVKAAENTKIYPTNDIPFTRCDSSRPINDLLPVISPLQDLVAFTAALQLEL